jgi:hypothetical protein
MAMASPLSSHLALHLADRALAPITSSSRQPSSSPAQVRSQAQALSSLTSSALVAYETASRLGLGVPERILIETQSSGPIVLHSYLNPLSVQRPGSWRVQSCDSGDVVAEETRAGMRSIREAADNGYAEQHGQSHEGLVNGVDDDETGAEEMGSDSLHQPSLLIATVVAPSSADSGSARKAAARLERTGRTFQREWVREQEQRRHIDAIAVEEDG